MSDTSAREAALNEAFPTRERLGNKESHYYHRGFRDGWEARGQQVTVTPEMVEAGTSAALLDRAREIYNREDPTNPIPLGCKCSPACVEQTQHYVAKALAEAALSSAPGEGEKP